MSLKNKKDFSKQIIISAVIAVVGYTAVHLFFSWHDKFIPAQLTIGWFTFWGTEIAVMAGIEVVKRKTGVTAEMLDHRQSNK